MTLAVSPPPSSQEDAELGIRGLVVLAVCASGVAGELLPAEPPIIPMIDFRLRPCTPCSLPAPESERRRTEVRSCDIYFMLKIRSAWLGLLNNTMILR